MTPFAPWALHGPPHHLARIALGLAIAALATSMEAVLWSTLPPSPFLFAYPAVVLAAWLGGRAAGVTTVLASAIALQVWLLPPAAKLALSNWRDVLDLGLFCAMSLLVVELIVRVRRALGVATVAAKTAEAASSARDTVLAVVAHDLRNPLQTIGLNAQLLAAEVPRQDERATERVVRIQRATTRARRLVEDVLVSARNDVIPFPVEVGSSSLSSLVDECLSPVKGLAAARSIEIELPTADTVAGSITCDRDRIIQVLSNLVGNALQYTSSGGRVAVGVRRTPAAVSFTVTDTGSGMTKHELEHAFDRLWHGQGPGHGTGLGLWISKALVLAHGGSIEAASEPGKGTRLTFVLPQPTPQTKS